MVGVAPFYKVNQTHIMYMIKEHNIYYHKPFPMDISRFNMRVMYQN